MGCEVKAGERIALGGFEGLDRSSRKRERYRSRGVEEEDEAAADAIVIDMRQSEDAVEEVKRRGRIV